MNDDDDVYIVADDERQVTIGEMSAVREVRLPDPNSVPEGTSITVDGPEGLTITNRGTHRVRRVEDDDGESYLRWFIDEV